MVRMFLMHPTTLVVRAELCWVHKTWVKIWKKRSEEIEGFEISLKSRWFKKKISTETDTVWNDKKWLEYSILHQYEPEDAAEQEFEAEYRVSPAVEGQYLARVVFCVPQGHHSG